jgi:hypothetical protein
MPRQPSRCSHCRDLGHNISRCSKYELDLVLNIHGREQNWFYSIIKTSYISWSKINLRLLSHMKLLIEGLIPFIVRVQYTGLRKTSLCIVRYENNRIRLSAEKVVRNSCRDYESIADASLHSYPNTIQRYVNEYAARISYFKAGCIHSTYNRINNLIVILTGDYVEITRRIGDEQRVREEVYQARRLERINQENQAANQVNQITNREILPIITDTAFETNNCPICLDNIGETGKSILRCGHQLCVSCLLTLTLRATLLSSCKCPVCRVSYM